MLRVYYLMFENRDGWLMALWFSVILNVNLALLNLIPMPVLDGGHIALAIVEALRRRPVNARVLEVVQTTCAVLIIGFMVFDLFVELKATDQQLDFPVVYASAKNGFALRELHENNEDMAHLVVIGRL